MLRAEAVSSGTPTAPSAERVGERRSPLVAGSSEPG